MKLYIVIENLKYLKTRRDNKVPKYKKGHQGLSLCECPQIIFDWELCRTS